jgi:hypothetical protein
MPSVEGSPPLDTCLNRHKSPGALQTRRGYLMRNPAFLRGADRVSLSRAVLIPAERMTTILPAPIQPPLPGCVPTRSPTPKR